MDFSAVLHQFCFAEEERTPLNIQKTEFIKSAAAKRDFIFDGRPVVIMAGRSNVGKSSVINALLNRKNFARVGASPGKTTQVNYFLVDETLYLIDLPGYGYAKRSFDERDRWAALIDDFFRMSADGACAALGLLVIDSRHGPLDADLTMADYYASAGIPFIVAANKCDKLNKTEFKKRKAEIETVFAGHAEVIMVSAEKGVGRAELLERINEFVSRAAAEEESL